MRSNFQVDYLLRLFESSEPEGRRAVAPSIARVLAGRKRPVLIDNSQMFGGLWSEYHDDFSRGLQGFGGHGDFFGSGLGCAGGGSSGRAWCSLARVAAV